MLLAVGRFPTDERYHGTFERHDASLRRDQVWMPQPRGTSIAESPPSFTFIFSLSVSFQGLYAISAPCMHSYQ